MSVSKLLMALLTVLLIHSVAAAQQAGEAIVEVEAPSGVTGTFAFEGMPAGGATAGGSLSANDLSPGRYESKVVAVPPGVQLIGISCDDVLSTTPSDGDVASGIARFNIDTGETVGCIFVFAPAEQGGGISENSNPVGGGSSGGGSTTNVPEPGNPVTGAPPDEEIEDGPGPCDAPAIVPIEGPWSVSNHTGRMVCNGPAGPMDMPLKASSEDGTLEVWNCGWTIVGTGMSDDTAPLEMNAIDGTSGRYIGEIGGMQDGIPMTIKFDWVLRSETWIEGSLSSSVSQQGMTCTMSRSFELRYAGD